jgi:hypothetical protein
MRIRKSHLELYIRGFSYDPGPRSGQLSRFVANGKLLGSEITYVIKINHGNPRPLRGYLIECDDIHRCDGLFSATLMTFPLLEIYHSADEPPMRLEEARVRQSLCIEFERMAGKESLINTRRKVINKDGAISMSLYFPHTSGDEIEAYIEEKSWAEGDRSIDLLAHEFHFA